MNSNELVYINFQFVYMYVSAIDAHIYRRMYLNELEITYNSTGVYIIYFPLGHFTRIKLVRSRVAIQSLVRVYSTLKKKYTKISLNFRRNYRNYENATLFARLQENFKLHPPLIRDITGALADRKNRVTSGEQGRSIPKRRATMKGDEASRHGGHFRGS